MKTSPLTAPRGGHEHDFGQPRESWETAVFDRAALFAVVELRRDRRRTEFRVLPWAIRYARMHEADGACLYAVASTGRFALLEQARWDEWATRWVTASEARAKTWLDGGLQRVLTPYAQKPHCGTIERWEMVSAPQGLGYAVSGTLGGRPVLTTSILARRDDEVETLSWRYALGEEKR